MILSSLGDVNADWAVDDADKTAMIGRVAAPLGYLAADYPGAAIFKYRCCDANNDRNINNLDANTIAASPAPVGFYLPTDYK